MKAIAILIGAVGVAMFLAGPVFAAQTTSPPAPNNLPASRIAANNPPRNGHDVLSGSLQKSHGEWRASKLVGAGVYNDSGDNIGSIDDLLMNDSGQIKTVVVSVGGFIGIGNKLVAVPFDKFKFEQSQRPHAAGYTQPGSVQPRKVNATAESTARPNPGPVEYSMVLPEATSDSLKSAPGFKY